MLDPAQRKNLILALMAYKAPGAPTIFFCKFYELIFLKEYIHRNNLFRRPTFKSPYDRIKKAILTFGHAAPLPVMQRHFRLRAQVKTMINALIRLDYIKRTHIGKKYKL